ncbi:MAG TPA: xanthine dehydrogenase family protein molybdopterin-binding subunit [Dehalococcoidia bacterium]|nr:xanthine dehydrogenase family protein molybdopterin-binding subunit [Dehalococcoidia bacterium]
MATETRPEYNHVGKRETRVEGATKVTGSAIYAADVQVPNMLHCKLVLSPHAHARIVSIDDSKALAVDGVVQVVTAEDMGKAVKDGSNPAIDAGNRGEALLAHGRAGFAGEPVAAVMAETISAAEEGAAAVEVVYDELPAVLDLAAAMEEDSPLARPPVADIDRTEEEGHVTLEVDEEEGEGKPSNISSHVSFTRGDIDEGFAASDVIVERTWHSAKMHQGYIEPHATVADYNQASGELTVWTATQGQFHVRDTIMRTLKWPETKLRVIGCELGGGFGGKMTLGSPLVSALTVIVGRPVKLVMTRQEDLTSANPAPRAMITVKSGMKNDGTLQAMEISLAYDAGAYPGAPAAVGALLGSSFYQWPNLKADGYEVLTNHVSVGAIRAPGTHNAMHAVEQNIDEMASLAGLDAAEVRAKNVSKTGDPMASGQDFTTIGLEETVAAAREHPLWTEREAARAESTETTKVGVGLAIGGWLGGLQPAAAEVLLNNDGTINAVTGAMDISGTNTSFAQIVAEELNLPLDKVNVTTGDTKTAPFAGMSAGSKTIFTVGRALKEAAIDLRDQMFEVAADRLEASENDLELVDSEVRVKGSAEQALEMNRLASMTTGFGALYKPLVGRGTIAARKQAPGFTAQLVKVEVNTETGNITLKDFAIVQDVGFAINPLSVEGQMEGGAVQGMGIGLWEEYIYDDEGHLRNAGLLDYRMPTAADVPDIDSVLVEVPSDDGPYGARGVGEPSITAGGAAIANAVADAIGTRVPQIPITPERVLRAMGTVGNDAADAAGD